MSDPKMELKPDKNNEKQEPKSKYRVLVLKALEEFKKGEHDTLSIDCKSRAEAGRINKKLREYIEIGEPIKVFQKDLKVYLVNLAE